MHYKANTPEQYIEQLPDERKVALAKLRSIILERLPKGFEETINYGMIGYIVPLSIYPQEYHASPKIGLPFINIASHKNYISLYHMGLYAGTDILNWFTTEYPKHSKTKLDMGKGCVRFKNPDQIPFELIGELVSKISCHDWIKIYESLKPK